VSGPRAVERVLIVGPLAAEWTRAAQEALRAAGFTVARLSDIEMIGMLLAAGGVRAVLVDARLIVPSLLNRIARLRAAEVTFPVVVIDARQDVVPENDPSFPLRVRWPAESERLLHLVGERAAG